MHTLSYNYQSADQLIQFTSQPEFTVLQQRGRLLVIQVSASNVDSSSVGLLIAQLRNLFPDALIRGRNADGNCHNCPLRGEFRLQFVFTQCTSATDYLTGKNTVPQLSDTQETDPKILQYQLHEKTRLIETFNRQITDSLIYASHIQKAIIPPLEYINRLFSMNFIVYRPAYFVSGDFYWVHERGNKIYWAVADCTGHGVPGALMSILGLTALADVSNVFNLFSSFSAADVLNQLRIQVKQTLHQTGKPNEIGDGMDIALCIIDREMMTVDYAGANIPLYLVRDEELIEYKPNKMPIGVHPHDKQLFSSVEFVIKPNDMLYISTDGYSDQIGGLNNKKFKRRNLKAVLQTVSKQRVANQKQILEDTLDVWKVNTEQTDDITVMGIRIDGLITPGTNYYI